MSSARLDAAPWPAEGRGQGKDSAAACPEEASGADVEPRPFELDAGRGGGGEERRHDAEHLGVGGVVGEALDQGRDAGRVGHDGRRGDGFVKVGQRPNQRVGGAVVELVEGGDGGGKAESVGGLSRAVGRRRQHRLDPTPLHRLYKQYQGDIDADQDLTQGNQYGVLHVDDLSASFKKDVVFANTIFQKFVSFEGR